jgi:hypothetical protein
MKDVVSIVVIMLLCIIGLSQQGNTEGIVLLPKPKPKQLKPAKHHHKQLAKDTHAVRFAPPVSVQILAGTQGIGADVKYGFLPNLSGRLGFGIIPVDASRGFGFSSFPVQGQLSTRFSNVHLLADYSPFNSTFFRFVGGAAYLINGSTNVLISPSKGYSFGYQTVTQQQFGAIHANATWTGIAPYLGVAFFKSFPERRFNMNLDIGSYYISSPSTSFTGTKLLADNDANAKQFNENMRGYRWLPVIQLNFNFRIK